MESVTFLTWNMALLERSAEAPQSWRQENTEATFRELVLELAPDIVLLQELPQLVPFVETHGMVRANPVSHSGNLATLVKHELMASEPKVAVVDSCAILTTLSDELTIANVHLAPGRGGEGQRLQQMAEIVESSPTARLLIAGDTNTRVDELAALAEADIVGDQPPSPTWDSMNNQFNSGRNAREFRAYFTRWFATPGVRVTDVRVHKAPIEHDGYRFHLSDHFALSGTVHSLAS